MVFLYFMEASNTLTLTLGKPWRHNNLRDDGKSWIVTYEMLEVERTLADSFPHER